MRGLWLEGPARRDEQRLAAERCTNLAEVDDPSSGSGKRDARRAEFLEAATEVFFRSGFAGASVDEVIAKVGGSKRTIYSYFGNKEQLFATIVGEISQRAMAPLSESTFERNDLESTLYEVGRRYIDVVMSPEALQLYRTVVGEGARFPDLAKTFFAAGPGRASARLAAVLRENAKQWGLQQRDCERLAEHFLGMIRDDLHLQVVLGLRPPPTSAQAEAAVRSAVRVFMVGAAR
ncbi:AcrR family transcriptional regulator [Bradyrhizobium elkanii]|jgi:AcrR family transcriptional regulator|nr:AcrR family transcriptional regulator [Bradyrhizobium elkanii]